MVRIPKYVDLPYHVRKSPRKRWDYLAELLNNNSTNDNSNSEQQTSRNVSITVNDGTDAVNGATVSIGETSATTGSAGGCTLQNITDGEHTISVTAEGFEEYSNTITVSEENNSFTISLTAEDDPTSGS